MMTERPNIIYILADEWGWEWRTKEGTIAGNALPFGEYSKPSRARREAMIPEFTRRAVRLIEAAEPMF